MNRINSTRFLEVEELRNQLEKIDLKEEKYRVGGIPLSSEGDCAWVDAEDNHTIVFGATGSKKTRMLVMPTVEILSRAGESFVVTDPKGEVYERTCGSVEKRGYQIFALNLRDYEAGEPWNPLLLPYQCYKSGDVAKAMELVSSIAEMLVDADLNDRYWSNTARDVAMGLMLYLFERSKVEAQCNINNYLALWQEYMQDKKAFNKRIRERYSGSIIRDKLQCLDNASDKTVGSIEAVFATGINRFSTNEKLIRYLSQPSLSFDDMLSEKTAIYLIVPDENNYYHFLISLFLEQFYEVLIKTAQKSLSAKLSNRMNFVIDEFANLPRIENMASMITASRSRNIRYVLIVQSMNQLTEKYGNTGQVICSNCNNWIYLYSKEYDLLTQISRLCGEVIYDNNMRMPLISEFDLQHLSKERGETLVLSGRNYPCLANLLDIDEYPFKKEAPKKKTKKKKESPKKADPVQTAPEAPPEPEPNPYVCAYPTKNTDTLQESVMSLDASGEEKEQVWLVAAFNGMIMKEYLVDRKKMADGTVVMEKCLLDFPLNEAAQLKWYRASSSLYHLYMRHLENCPQYVYLTVEEVNKLGGEHLQFTPNSLVEWGNACRQVSLSKLRKWDPPQIESYLAFMIIWENGEKRTVDMPSYMEWNGELGRTYRHNLMFREANLALAGTKFENVNWEMTDAQCLNTRYETISYEKIIDKNNYVNLTIYYDFMD